MLLMSINKASVVIDYDYFKKLLQLNGKLSTLFNKKRHTSPEIINPFMYPWDIPWYHWLKMFTMTFLLIPLRFLAFIVPFTMSYLLCLIATAGDNDGQRRLPMCGWRKNIIMPLFHVFARLSYFFSSIQWISVKGKRCSRKEAPILVLAPHSAYMDSMVVVYLGMSSVLGKTETANSIMGYFLRMTQPILVTREDPNSRQNTVDQIVRRVNSNDDWPQVLIFPEGTCTNRSCLINFKTGAFIPGCSIQPVVLRWPNRVDCITWTWEGPGVWTLLWMLFTQFHTYLEIEFLSVYHPSMDEKKNPRLFAENVRTVMAKALNIPTTNHSYEDCRHMTLAKKHGLPFSEIIVEFSRLVKRIIQQFPDTEAMLIGLKPTDTEPISAQEMCRQISLPDCEVLINRVFQFYDKDNTGRMNFTHFFCHLALYALPFQRKRALEYIFDMFRIDDVISGPIVSDVIQQAFLLSVEEADAIVSSVQSHQYMRSTDQTFTDVLESIMEAVGEPFTMYRKYQQEYNKSQKQTQSQNSPTKCITTDSHFNIKGDGSDENHRKYD